MLRRLLVVIALACFCSHAFASKVSDLTRIKGQGEFKLRGLGLVVGPPAPATAAKTSSWPGPSPGCSKPKAMLPENSQNSRAPKSVAVVVDVTIPEVGGRSDDRFDAYISTAYKARAA